MQALKNLERIQLRDLVLDAPAGKNTTNGTALAVLLKDEHLVPMYLNAVELDDVWMMQHLHDGQLVANRVEMGEIGGVLESNLLRCHETAGVEVDRDVHLAECAGTDEPTLLPPNLHVRRRRR